MFYFNRFHYDFFKKQYPDARLLFTDTDSLYYYVETEDIEKDLFEHKELFDNSDPNYPEKYQNYENKLVIGKFKSETHGTAIIEFIGLKAKMYSYVYQRVAHPESDLQEKQRAKGIVRAAAKQLKHQQYADQLKAPIGNVLYNRRIGSERHKLYTYSVLIFPILLCALVIVLYYFVIGDIRQQLFSHCVNRH